MAAGLMPNVIEFCISSTIVGDLHLLSHQYPTTLNGFYFRFYELIEIQCLIPYVLVHRLLLESTELSLFFLFKSGWLNSTCFFFSYLFKIFSCLLSTGPEWGCRNGTKQKGETGPGAVTPSGPPMYSGGPLWSGLHADTFKNKAQDPSKVPVTA